MILRNPTPNEIKVQIEGVHYTLPANGELKGVPDAHGEYWKVNLHQFIEVEPEDTEEEITKKAAKTPDAPESNDSDEKKDEVNLDDLKRDQLDELALAHGLNPDDYSSIPKIKAALQEVAKK